MSRQRQDDGVGCAIFAALVVLALVVAAAVSLAAAVDPFAWLPSLTEVWADCEDRPVSSGDDCSIGTGYEGFWVHVAINLAYSLITACVLIAFAASVVDFRKTRYERFGPDDAVDRYAKARSEVVGGAAVLAVLAAIPILVAVL